MDDSRTILVVDDEPAIVGLLTELFEADGYKVLTSATGIAALNVIKDRLANPISLVILDVGLPDIDGRDIVRQVRREGIDIPILLLTASTTEDDQVLGLESGATDYVEKPLRLQVLSARVKMHLTRHESSADAELVIGRYLFSPGHRTLTGHDNERLRLTEKEALLLRLLYQAKGAVVSRHDLLREVWGYSSAIHTHTLETHIYRLRQKIEPDPAQSRYVITEGSGYRLRTASERAKEPMALRA